LVIADDLGRVFLYEFEKYLDLEKKVLVDTKGKITCILLGNEEN